MVNVGQTVLRTPITFGQLADEKVRHGKLEEILKPIVGVVVYVHPAKRFHVVEFTNFCGDKVRESFWGVG